MNMRMTMRHSQNRLLQGQVCWDRDPFRPCANEVMFSARSYPPLLVCRFGPRNSRRGLICRSGCALMGLSGTFVGKGLIAGTGLLRTGIIASTFQATVLGSAAFIYHLYLSSASSAVVSPHCCFLACGCLLLSSRWRAPSTSHRGIAGLVKRKRWGGGGASVAVAKRTVDERASDPVTTQLHSKTPGGQLWDLEWTL